MSSAFPAGYSDPSNKSQYGAATYETPPQPTYPSDQAPPMYPPPQYGAPPPQYGGPLPQYGAPPAQFGTPNPMMGNLTQEQIQQLQATTVAITVGLDPNNPANNENSVQMKCPACQAQITTATSYVTGSCTFVWCIMLLFMGFILCFWMPFVMDCSKDVVHTCPSCKADCGRFVRQQSGGIRVGGGGGRVGVGGGRRGRRAGRRRGRRR